MSLNSFFGFIAQQIAVTYDTYISKVNKPESTEFIETTPSVDFKSANVLESLASITCVSHTHIRNKNAKIDQDLERCELLHCAFYGSARGCKFGNECKYKHEDIERVIICRFWKSKSGCKFGNNCKFRHFITEDEQLSSYLRNLQHDNKQQTWCNIKAFKNKSFEFKFDEHKTGKIELFKRWTNKISFQMQKRIFSDWDHDVDAIMEGFVTFDKRKKKLQLITQNIFIHNRTELDGDSYGSMIVPSTTVFERDYFIQSYWIKEFENAFYCVCDDIYISDSIIIHILSFIGFPAFQQDSVFFFILDSFCFQFSLDVDAKEVWDIDDMILNNSFCNDWSNVDKKYDLIRGIVKLLM